MPDLLDNEKTIIAIYFDDPVCYALDLNWCYRVGVNEVTRIKCYGEPGHMALLPWFAVWKGKSEFRVNGNYVVAVEYAEGE